MNKRIFKFTEEMGGHVIFTPKENSAEILARLNIFEVIDSKGGARNYDFRPFVHGLKEKKIVFSELESMLSGILMPYHEVRYEISPDEAEGDEFAFGEDRFVLFGGVDDEKIFVDWLELYRVEANSIFDLFDENRLTDIINFFHTLGRKYDLVLLDWKNRVIVDLEDKNKIETYIKG